MGRDIADIANKCISVTGDGGGTWPQRALVRAGPAALCSLARLWCAQAAARTTFASPMASARSRS